MSATPWPNPNALLPGGVSPQPYSDFNVALSTQPFAKPTGEGWASAIGIVCDALVESMILAVKCRFPTTAPPDALPYIGQERGLDQLPNESVASYRLRLINAWAAWKTAGTRLGVYNAISLLGYASVTIKENIEWLAPPSPGFAPLAEWWRFWVIIDQPHPFSASWYIGDGTVVGVGKSVGVSAPAGAIAALRAQIKKWKPAHALLVNIVVILSGKLIGYSNGLIVGPGNTWIVGDGTLVGGKVAYI